MFFFYWVLVHYVIIKEILEALNLNFGEFIFGLIGAFISFAAAVIAYQEYQVTRKREKIERFKLSDKFLGSNYVLLNQKALDIYKEQHADFASVQKEEQLIYENENWSPKVTDGLIKIDEMNLSLNKTRLSNTFSFEETSAEKSIQKFLPKKNLSYVENSLMYTNKNLWDAPTFIVDAVHMHNNNRPCIILSLSNYYDFYNSCMSYGHLQAYASIDCENGERVKNVRLTNEITDFSNRLCGVGVVTLTLIKGLSDKLKIILHYRARDLGEGRGLLNAVPAGTLQPFSSNFLVNEKEVPLAVRVNIIRELGEELLGRREFADCYNEATFVSNNFAKHIDDNLYYLGLGFNPLNTYLEILTMAVIDFSEKIVQDEFGVQSTPVPNMTNEEIARLFSPNNEGLLEIIDFTEDNLNYIAEVYSAAPALRQICLLLKGNVKYILSQI